MRSIDLLIRIMLLLPLLVLPAGCGGGGSGGGAPAGPTLSSITVTPANASIAAGASQQFTATGTFSDGSTQNLTAEVAWSASPSGVVTISAAGIVSAPASGPSGVVTVTATSGSISGSKTLTVTPILVSLAVTPANQSIAIGGSLQFTATGTFSDGTTQNLTSQASWTSSSTVVQIGTTGLATSPSAGSTGTATIKATSGAITGFTSLTVAGAPVVGLVSIAVTPANASITSGGTQQFTATGTFSNSTPQDLTNQVAWSASPSTVLTINAAGLASAPGATGTATVTAISGAISGSTLLTVTASSVAGANVMAITVNGTLCSGATSANYFNKPCVSVTVCNPGSSTCQTVNDILLDTGSYGLRVFNSALTGLALTQATSGSGGSLAECIQFADNSSIWGPVKIASVKLGNEPAVQIPIQVIDAGFATPTSCGTPDATPAAAGYTGILGVGPLPQDCGSNCTTRVRGVYFSCTGSTCTGTTVPLADQVPNPVASLPVDNNGLLVQLPPVALGGVSSLTGSLILGIGTQANNTPTVAPTVLATNGSSDFSTVYNGAPPSTSFLDTGSNALFFPSTFPSCTGANSPWFCPTSTTTQSATLVSVLGAPSKTVQFSIGNANTLFATNKNVFFEIGGTSTFGFDWGLPFFMGKNVYFGISGFASPGLGTGPFVAF